MITKRSTTLSVLLLCVASGCTASDLAADAGVTVTGEIQGADGGALGGAQVLLLKEPDVGEAIGGIVEVLSTLGIACLGSNAPAICAQGFTDTTSGSGTFSFALTGAQTQGSVNDADTFELATQAPASAEGQGPSASEQFIINATVLGLPALRLWAPALSFSATATSATVTFEALTSSYGNDGATAVAFASATGALVWRQTANSGATIDARLLEDAQGTVVATATATGQATATAITFNYQSGGVTFAGTAGPAPSRGAACFEQGLSGPVAITPCTLTDGDFGTGVALQSCSGESCGTQTLNNWAYVDLGASRAFSLVVVRGVASSSVIETSSDASTWSALPGGTGSGTFSAVGSGSARYVRVRASSTSADISGLAEISVW